MVYHKATPLTKLFLPLSISFLIGLGASCGRTEQTNQTKETGQKSVKEQLIEANRSRVEIESERIDAFVERRKWNVTKTGTGLRYMIYQDGEGPTAKKGDRAKVNFSVSLLDGTECYSSEESGPQVFTVGMDNVESGLHEGITYMKTGSKAKLILPSHLAHGLIGDQNKIPANATIIYDIELLGIQ